MLDRDLPTIVTEQQADCFAGAWVAHVRDGEAAGLTFTDADVRTGLVAMITVRDPIGIDQFEPGGHGSAFDRVGAFQTGFTEGAGPLRRAHRRPAAARAQRVPTDRDAIATATPPFGYGEGEVLGFLPGRPQRVLGRRRWPRWARRCRR